MEVITIGRSHDNNVRVNDPYVGRHHCQIIQHDDGSFSIVDMKSTNGTFVGGRRVFGEVKLRSCDIVTIGHTNIPWEAYFTQAPHTSKTKALPVVLGFVGGAMLVAAFLVLVYLRLASGKSFDFKGEYPSATLVDMQEEDGTLYKTEAVEGQVCVWFKESCSYKDARRAIKESGGRIVAQIPKNGYYLVEISPDEIQSFLMSLTKQNGVDWAYPNIVYYPCEVSNYVLDTDYPDMTKSDTTPHGIIVRYALWDSDPETPLKSYNIGAKNGKEMNSNNSEEGGLCFIFGCSHNEYFALNDISKISGNEPIIINMSYGPALKRIINGKETRILWKSATDEEKRIYKEDYIAYLKTKIKNLSTLKGRDYIAVIAAGNDGVKDFDSEILSCLRNKLSPEEKEVMDMHVMLVAAGEKRKENQYYSNEMESGRYSPWITKVDISDFAYNGEKRRGTSFAAPRAAGILSSIANEMELTGAEVLKYAREATLHDPNHELTYESLLMTVLADRENLSRNGTISSDIIQPVKHEPNQISNPTQTQNNNTSIRPGENRQTSGMGQYDYSFTISYSEELFKNKSQAGMNLPNGDVINYQYVYECDFIPEYYMKFTLGNGGDITSKYSIALVETLQAERGYVGTDDNGYIDMRISYMGFDPQSSSKMIVLIKKK